MNICALLSTRERLNILKYVIYKNGALTISGTAGELGLSKGLASKYFHILIKEKILLKSNNKFFVKDNLNTRSLRVLLNLIMLRFEGLFRKYRFVRAAGLYGSFVKGTNTEDSDIDMWVLIEKVGEERIKKLTNELKRMSEKIKPLYLTAGKIGILKKEDPVFHSSLVFGSINVCGEGIETV
jgi:predicted nucleotidyltransferase